MRAIVSVHDKSGLASFARGLVTLGVEVFSTGGTQKALETEGLAVGSISRLTGFPEILDGRVKSLHPAVYGGILARRDIPAHMAQLKEHHIQAIDMVVVNLYPFVQTVSRDGVTLEEALENIDIGGPTLIRAAAKNFPHTIVVVDPSDYQPVLASLRQGGLSLELRKRLAQKAFQHVASYDTAIARYLRDEGERFPQEMTVALHKGQDLRYGENPHQAAAFYFMAGEERYSCVASAQRLGGAELSFNNILDLDAAFSVVAEFSRPTIAIIKHNNPCGLASRDDLSQAYRLALAGDPVAAFGGVVASNRRIDAAAAAEICKTHFDSIVAPGYDAEALAQLQRKRDLRILSMGEESVRPTGQGKGSLDFRKVSGGLLVQTPDLLGEEEMHPRTVTRREPTAQERRDLLFAWKVAKHIKSNAITIAREESLLGMGAGQPSRVVSVELALKRAGEGARGSALASDAFFPFTDGVELAAAGGVTAIIQPGGSVRDAEVIEKVNEKGMAMVFTGVRHFRH